jgi:hypothetical protein
MSVPSPLTPKPTLADIVGDIATLRGDISDTTCHLHCILENLQAQITMLYHEGNSDCSGRVAAQKEHLKMTVKLNAEIATLKHEVDFHVARKGELYRTVHALEKRMKEMEVFFGGGKAEPKIKIEKE